MVLLSGEHCQLLYRRAIRFLLTLAAFDLPEKKDQPLGNCRVSENRIAQHGKRHSSDHRSLNGGHQLARLDAERGKSQDFVAVFANQHLHEAARFGNRPGAEHSGYRHLRHTVLNSIASRLGFVTSDPRQFRIGEHAERHQAIFRGSIARAAPIRSPGKSLIDT